MREIIVKYQGMCSRCKASLNIGEKAMYEKTTGIFCIGHEPTTPEEIRSFRAIKAEQKSNKLQARAQRLRDTAEEKMKGFNHFRGDTAFITQPGHIPFRNQIMNRYDKGLELLEEAKKIERRAENIKNVRVAGDTERHHEEHRKALDRKITVGGKIFSPIYGEGTIKKINRKTLGVDFGNGGRLNRVITVDKTLCKIPEEVN